MNKKNNRKGFTIVELVIVIAVIAILATVLVPTFGNVIEKANASKYLQAARNELTDYMVDHAADGNDDLIIAVAKNATENVYFAVVNGQLKETVYTTMTATADKDDALDAFGATSAATKEWKATAVTNSTTVWTVAEADKA